jgi:glycosyltransferase involved in cell wall biosynthesis
MRGAAPLVAFSHHAAAPVAAEFALKAEVLPLGVNTSLYEGRRPPTPHPWIMCAAAADDRRKRVDVLVRAFVELTRHHATAQLLLVQPRPEAAEAIVRDLDRDVRERVAIQVPRSSEHIAELYRGAAISVLPSVDEAFGLVMVESLAAGTPVVGTTWGAAAEVISDDAIGRLTPPDDPSAMARAMLETLELATDDGTPDACRAAASQWDWDVIGARWLALHESRS